MGIQVAIVGATGLVGSELRSILVERSFPIDTIGLYASANSAGQSLEFGDDEVHVEELQASKLEGYDLVFLAGGGEASLACLKHRYSKRPIFIDKSSRFRLEDDVPLVVPGVNSITRHDIGPKSLIATPNCTTIPLVQFLECLRLCSAIDAVHVTSMQAVSGAGKRGVEVLDAETRAVFQFKDAEENEVFEKRIAFNVQPWVSSRCDLDHGHTDEEQKLQYETQKILGQSKLKVSATCSRVPVFHGHSLSIMVDCNDEPNLDELKTKVEAFDGLRWFDQGDEREYPTLIDAVGADETCVGRVRCAPGNPKRILAWLVSDNIRTGAALNAVRIAEEVFPRDGFASVGEDNE